MPYLNSNLNLTMILLIAMRSSTFHKQDCYALLNGEDMTAITSDLTTTTIHWLPAQFQSMNMRAMMFGHMSTRLEEPMSETCSLGLKVHTSRNFNSSHMNWLKKQIKHIKENLWNIESKMDLKLNQVVLASFQLVMYGRWLLINSSLCPSLIDLTIKKESIGQMPSLSMKQITKHSDKLTLHSMINLDSNMSTITHLEIQEWSEHLISRRANLSKLPFITLTMKMNVLLLQAFGSVVI
jgi:hypothetical protein